MVCVLIFKTVNGEIYLNGEICKTELLNSFVQLVEFRLGTFPVKNSEFSYTGCSQILSVSLLSPQLTILT